jgi:hypothetical protein
MDGQGLANESDGMRRRDGDPTWKVEWYTAWLIQKSALWADMKKDSSLGNHSPPVLYGQPLIHREGMPIGLIVDVISTPAYRLAEHLAELLATD